MLNNYFITAYRNMMRHKLYSLINIGGLAIGLAACILIFLFVKDELSYDDWGAETQSLYRLEIGVIQNSSEFTYYAVSPGRLFNSLAKDYTNEFSAISRFFADDHTLKRDGDVFQEVFWFADKQIFDIFDIEMIRGTRADVFRDNRSVIIDQSMALKYFGDTDPIGQTLDPVDEDHAYKVVGVMKDLPEKSHLNAKFISMFDPERYIDRPWIAQNWLSSNVYTYVKLAEGASPTAIEESLPSYLDRTVIRSEQSGLNEAPSNRSNLRLMPVSDIHLSAVPFSMKSGGDIKVVYSFTAMALLILIIASINFINLSTARSSMRAKEIALRKVVGASRGQLITQFLGESGLMVLVALITALAIVEYTLPSFNEFAKKILSLNYGADPVIYVGLIGLLIIVGIGAGILPAIHITRFRPATALRGNNSGANADSKLRVMLVCVQFAISIGLIVTTIIVYSQTQYANSKDLGFSSKNRLMLQNMDNALVKPVLDTILQEINRLPSVVNTAYTDRRIPIGGYSNPIIRKREANDSNEYRLEMVTGDANFLNFLDARLVAGRIFSKDFLSDSMSLNSQSENVIVKNVVINRAAVTHLNLGEPEQALGEVIIFENSGGNKTQLTIVGVIEDLLLRSLRNEVEPLALHVKVDNHSVLNVQIAPENQAETTEAIRMIWKRHVPSFPIDLSFMDERFDQLYEDDAQRGLMFGYFSIFAVFISCLGLYGLSAFTAEQRTKEIGIRKVYGAGNFSIISLLVWQFSKPVLFANLIAWPVTWYIMQDWLSGYAYRIDMTILPFTEAGIIALLIAWSTVSFHAWRVSRTNPIYALRCE